MNVCQKCGDRGEMKRLIYCNKCHVSAEHSYCLDTLPRKGEKEVLWACEECCSIDANPNTVSSRKSERIQGAAKIKLNRMKLRKQARFSPFTAKAYTDNSSQVNQPVSDYFGLKDTIETQSTSQCLQNEELKKPRRRMVVKDDNSSDEESDLIECLVANPVQPAPAISADSLNVSHSSLSSESDRNIHAKPTIDPIWKGSFNIQNLENHTSVLLLAHLSTNACSKVRDAASALPVQLNVEILSRSDAWPHTFQTIPPTVESIEMKKVFDSLLDEMIIHDHALKVVINDLELLVFSSCELPQEHWRFCQKYFLWGVFKATKKHDVGSNAEASNLSNNAVTQGGESLG
uniref:AIPP2-like SPOC-like domain-containing protein n=1 Tax=Salix viminalis TaxID=40686 RepID=A0A6N2L9N9_SALVM